MRKVKKILVIGGGWYGCHIARILLEIGHEVTLYEKEEKLFGGASSNNQNRLHLGFHYPRCYLTRNQSKRGYHLFVKTYGEVVEPVKYNLYAIDNGKSILDFNTYKQIMSSTGLNFEDVTQVSPIKLDHVEGIIDCEEMLINPNKARKYFEAALADCVEYEKEFTLNDLEIARDNYDLIVDCTWMALGAQIHPGIYFEPFVYWKYKCEKNEKVAITLMDGDLYSLYPMEDSCYTLTSVRYGPLGNCKNYREAGEVIERAKINIEGIVSRRHKAEQEFSNRYREFESGYQFDGYCFAIKTKKISAIDSRYVTSYYQDKLLSIMSGKIDTIFDAESVVRRTLEK